MKEKLIMKNMSNLSFIKLTVSIVVSASIVACGKSSDTSSTRHVSRSEAVALSCGTNSFSGQMRISERKDGPKPGQFAILLNGSPGTSFFADSGKTYRNFTQSLLADGYRVLELKYPHNPANCGLAGSMDGFYSACCKQGLPNVTQHSKEVYQIAISKLGYDPSNPNHKLTGVGFSLGAVQLQSMAFISGEKFEKIPKTDASGDNQVCTMGFPGITS
jgi:hypothetical protein